MDGQCWDLCAAAPAWEDWFSFRRQERATWGHSAIRSGVGVSKEWCRRQLELWRAGHWWLRAFMTRT